MADQSLDDDVQRAIDALGRDYVEFMTNSPIEHISTKAVAVALVAQVNAVLHTQVDGRTDVEGMGSFLRHKMGETLDGRSIALRLYLESGGQLEEPLTNDDLEAIVVEVAAQAYGLFLLPVDPALASAPKWMAVDQNASSFLFLSEVATKFQNAVLADKDLAAAFSEYSETSGHSTPMIYRNTGRGSSVQLWSLASMILRRAWWTIDASDTRSIMSFREAALKQWRLIRDALLGTLKHTHGLFTFTGVKLPSDKQYLFGDATLRPTTAKELSEVDTFVNGQLSGGDPSGAVTINYGGEITVEVQIPFAAAVQHESLEDQLDFPVHLKMFQFEPLSRRLRLSLLLAMSRSHRVQMALSWYQIDDPLDHGMGQGYSDPRRAVGLMPTQLTDVEMGEWQRWYDLLGLPGADRLDIAGSRVLRAISERGDPTDVLIDAVIAWENVFGSSQGEPTLRVTASMARIFELDPEARRTLRTKLGKIYALRSSAVHGSSLLKPTDIDKCDQALSYAIKLLQAIYTDRQDLLAEPDGTGRSLRVLME